MTARFSRAHLVVALAGVVGALLTLSAVRAEQHSVTVLGARHDLVAGARITAADLDTVAVHAGAGVLATIVTAHDQRLAVGRVVVHDLRAGDLIRGSDLRDAAGTEGRRSMSFAVDAAAALDGHLSAGDRIDVVAVAHDGTNAGYVLVDAPVLAVSDAVGTGPLRDPHARVTLTVALDDADALRLAAAQAAADVSVVRSTGARRLGAVPRYLAPTKGGVGA